MTAALGEFEVDVLTSSDPTIDRSLPQGYRLHPVVDSWSIWSLGDLCRQILQLDPTVVCIQNPTLKYCGMPGSMLMSLLVPLLKKLAPDLRLVVMQHDIAVSYPLFRRRYWPLVAAADAVIVSNLRDYQAVSWLGAEPGKLYRAPVSSHFRMPLRSEVDRPALRQKFGIPADAVCVCYFGFIHRARSVDSIIHAIALMAKANRDVFGLMVGGPSVGAEDYSKDCRALAEELGLADRIVWTGYASERKIVEALAAADVFVSLPNCGADMRNTSIMAAMLAELPSVARKNDFYYNDPELDRLGCVCLDDSTPEAVCGGIEKALTEPLTDEFMARRRRLVEPDRLWPIHIDITCRAYKGQPPPIADSIFGDE